MTLMPVKLKWKTIVRRISRFTAGLLSLLIILSTSAFALPTGWEVIEGNVTVDVTDNIMTITSTTDTAVINYITFDLASGETINFVLPNAGASILNRVIGGDISSIGGSINSNGRLGIVNTAGIYMANTAQIQSAALLASTLNISNDDFFSDVISASKNPDNVASIINEGEIDITNGGYALFVANSIVNTGNIIAEDGTIHMAVGDKVTFNLSDNSSIQVTIDDEISQMVDGLNSAIINHGAVQAHAVEMKATLSKSLLKQSINNTGIIQGTAMDNVGGKIVIRDDQGIVSNTGLVYAGATQENAKAGEILIRGQSVYNGGALMAQSGQGETGGTVHMLGDVVINEGGFIDVSGDLGGGEALIGGDFQGNGDTYTARLNMADQDTLVLADAYSSGDGGKVIFWSDEDTFFYGEIKARGGLDVGDGGFAEVSGHKYLDMKGDADLTATNGDKGTLLLDPTNILITEFDPSDPANLELWYDADDATTISTTGSDVDQWDDKSGNGYHASKSGGARPTTGTNTINGRQTIEFNGSGDNLAISGKSYTTSGEISGLSLFSVQRVYTTGRNMILSFDRSETFRYTIGDDSVISGNSRNVGFDTQGSSGATWDSYGGTNVVSSAARLTGASYDAASGAKVIYADGTAETSITDDGNNHAPGTNLGSGTNRFGFLGVGSEASSFDGSTGPNNWFHGDMGEVLMYERALSYDETMQVNQYLTAKWGVAFNENLANISVFNDTFIEYLTQTSDVSLLADQNITVANLSDNLLALGSRDLTLTATSGNITFADTNDVIRTEGGDITMVAGGNLTLGTLNTRGASGTINTGSVNLSSTGSGNITMVDAEVGRDFTVSTTGAGNITLGSSGVPINVVRNTSLTSGTGDVYATGAFTGNMTGSAGRFGLSVTSGDLTSTGITASGSTGWNGSADETLVVQANNGDVLGAGYTTTGAGNIRLQAGATGSLGAGSSVNVTNLSAAQNANLFASGDDGGISIQVGGTSNIAGTTTATGFNASNNFTATTGRVNIVATSGNINTAMVWGGEDVYLTANAGSITQNTAQYGMGYNNSKTVYAADDIFLTAQGAGSSHIDTGIQTLSTVGNLTALANGSSGGTSIRVIGRVDGNGTFTNTSNGNTTGDIWLGTSLGASFTNLDDTDQTMDIRDNVTVKSNSDVNMYGAFGLAGTIDVIGSRLTARADKWNLNFSRAQTSATTGNGIDVTAYRGNLLGSTISTAGSANIVLQAGNSLPLDKMSFINLSGVTTAGNLNATAYGSNTGNQTGNSITITGSTGGSTSTTSHVNGIVSTP